MNDRIYYNTIDKLRSPERMARLEIDKVVNFCIKEKGINTLLDIGTGSGVFAEAFSKAGLKVSGIDINEEMLEEARTYAPDSEFKLGSAENIPSDDEEFDAAFFGMVFHEVSDYKKSLSEAFRVTKKYTFILEWKFKTEDFGPPIEHRLSPEFIKNLVKEVGYKNFKQTELTNLILYILIKD